jgi:hypothetical protein
MERVLERERMEVENLTETLDLFLGRRRQIEPEELIALQVLADRLFLEGVEAPDHEAGLGWGCALR